MDLSNYDDVAKGDEDAQLIGGDHKQIVSDIINVPKLAVDEFGKPIFTSIADAIKKYVEIRDALKVFNAKAKLVDDNVKEDLSKISMWLRDKGDEFGVDSFKSNYGTAFRSVKTSYRMGDWTAFIKWVEKQKMFQCLEKRVAKNATKEIHDAVASRIAAINEAPEEEQEAMREALRKDFGFDDNDGVPPGVSYMSEVEFDVRRPTATKGK